MNSLCERFKRDKVAHTCEPCEHHSDAKHLIAYPKGNHNFIGAGEMTASLPYLKAVCCDFRKKKGPRSVTGEVFNIGFVLRKRIGYDCLTRSPKATISDIYKA
jgi:hypothetical protein